MAVDKIARLHQCPHGQDGRDETIDHQHNGPDHDRIFNGQFDRQIVNSNVDANVHGDQGEDRWKQKRSILLVNPISNGNGNRNFNPNRKHRLRIQHEDRRDHQTKNRKDNREREKEDH